MAVKKKKPGVKSTGKFKKERPAQWKKDRTPKEKKKRAARNKARNAAIKSGKAKKGDGKDIDHRKPLSKGGSTKLSNTRVRSRKSNRAAGGAMSKRGKKK